MNIVVKTANEQLLHSLASVPTSSFVIDSNPLVLMINPQSRASASGLARYKQDANYYVCSTV